MSGEINLGQTASNPSPPTSGRLILFAKSDGLYQIMPDGIPYKFMVGALAGLSYPQMTNRSGGGLIVGSVVVMSTDHDNSVLTTNLLRDMRPVGVSMQAIANNSTGSISTFHGDLVSVLCTAPAVSRGEFLITSATAGHAQAAGFVRSQGVFAVALTAKSAGSAGIVQAMLVHDYLITTIGTLSYSIGGFDTAALVNGQRFTFASATWATVASMALPAARARIAGVGNTTASMYMTGGSTADDAAGAQLHGYRMPYSTELSAAFTPVNLPVVRSSLRYGHNSQSRGYVCGGHNSGGTAQADLQRILYSTEVLSTMANLSSARVFSQGCSDGTFVYTAGSHTPTNRITVATDAVAAHTDANMTTGQDYSAMSFPARAGYYVAGTTGVKITFSSGVASASGGPPSTHNMASAICDGFNIGFVSGHSAAPRDVSSSFNATTEAYATAAVAIMALGKHNAAVANRGAF